MLWLMGNCQQTLTCLAIASSFIDCMRRAVEPYCAHGSAANQQWQGLPVRACESAVQCLGLLSFLAFLAAFLSLGLKAGSFLVSLLLFCSLPMVCAPNA